MYISNEQRRSRRGRCSGTVKGEGISQGHGLARSLALIRFANGINSMESVPMKFEISLYFVRLLCFQLFGSLQRERERVRRVGASVPSTQTITRAAFGYAGIC